MIRIVKEDDRGGRAQTSAHMTVTGRKRFLEYLSTLEQVIRDATVAQQDDEKEARSRKLVPVSS